MDRSTMSANEEEFSQCDPPDIVEAARNVSANLLPKKSRDKYVAVYDKFIAWRLTKKTNSFSENVMLSYFSELSENLKPSTLWSQYSMLKSTISANNNIDIATYSKLSAFLKRQSTGFESKKSKVLTATDVEEFLNKAPDDQFLATKVALIFGVAGACRREELCHITTKDINDTGSMALITIPRTKTNIRRSFTVVGKFYDIFKTYAALRPKDTTSERFFLNYQKGKCTQQVIGLNKFGSMPRQIASYLDLPNPETYTGHTFRRTSATLLADSGADITTLKRHGGWKSNQVAEGYIEDSLNNKTKIGKQIMESVHVRPSTSIDVNSTPKEPPPKRSKVVDDEFGKNDNASTSGSNIDTSTVKNSPFHLYNCSNITINMIKNED